MSEVGKNDVTGVDESILSKAQALYNYLSHLIAGETNPDSATNAYLKTRKPANVVLLTGISAITIGAGAANDTHLIGIFIHTALVGTLTIDGFADSGDAAESYIIPIGFVGAVPLDDSINSKGALTMTLSSATDNDVVLVRWRPI